MTSSSPQVDSTAEETASWWAARLDGSDLSINDRANLDAWLAQHPGHRTLLAQYCQLGANLEVQLPQLPTVADDAALYPLRHRSTRAWWLASAAAIAAAAAAFVVLPLVRPSTQPASLASSAAQRQDVTLADGSRVELNALTSVALDFSRTERRVRLASGQAFFSVARETARPFIIETPAGSIRVTGTEFDVRAEGIHTLEVLVRTGSVQVRPVLAPAHSGEPIRLEPGQRLRTGGSSGAIVERLSTEAVDDALAWRRGQIVFSGTPLREALQRFGRYHGRGLGAAPGAAELPVGGRFKLGDLDGFLASLEDVWPVQVVQLPDGTIQVRLRSEP